MIASDSSPPSGKPISTLALFSPRSFGVHPSSTAPLEKKNTSYGVIAAPKRAIAKYAYVNGVSVAGTAGWAASETSCPQSGPSFQTATTKTRRHKPNSPNTCSMTPKGSRQHTTHTRNAQIGIRKR